MYLVNIAKGLGLGLVPVIHIKFKVCAEQDCKMKCYQHINILTTKKFWDPFTGQHHYSVIHSDEPYTTDGSFHKNFNLKWWRRQPV